MTDDQWKRFLDTKDFRIVKYNPETRYSTAQCRKCSRLWDFPGQFTKLKKQEGGEEWIAINKKSNKYYDDHKRKECVPHEPPPPPTPCEFKLTESIETWTAAKVTEYLLKLPGDPPGLLRITKTDEPLIGNPKYCCIFTQPGTGLASNDLWMSSSVLCQVPAYKDTIKAYQEKKEEEKQEAEVHSLVHRAVDRAIWTVEMETEHIRAPKRPLLEAMPPGPFQQKRPIEQDALYAYHLMMFAFKDHPGMPITITQETMATLLDATFYGPPRLEPMRWKWSGESFGDVGVRCTLLYKPHALHSFLLLCQQTGGRIALVVDDKPSQTIPKDIYGFTHRPLPLPFHASGKDGVVCAVLCHGEVDPLMVHDRSLVLPIAVLGKRA